MPVEDTLTGVGFLPPSLDKLLRGLRVVAVRQVLIRGWGSLCATDDHSMKEWIVAIYRGRNLVIRVCELCEAAEVRDRTRTVTAVRGAQMRSSPDILLGWYTGARANQRVYT